MTTLPFPDREGPSRGNQGAFVPDQKALLWQRLRFRTEGELAVARALDSAGVLFFPLSGCRVSTRSGQRKTREVDVLVIVEGEAGILEIDGAAHNGRLAEDQERDREFARTGGITFTQRYTDAQAQEQPDLVVKEFLALFAIHRHRRPAA
jgi:hypothetical protein